VQQIAGKVAQAGCGMERFLVEPDKYILIQKHQAKLTGLSQFADTFYAAEVVNG
jgi:hypothetical protein